METKFNLKINRIGYLLPLLLLVAIALVYAIVHPASFLILDLYPSQLKEPFAFLILLVVLLVLPICSVYIFGLLFLNDFYRPLEGMSLTKIVNFCLFGTSKIISIFNISSKPETLYCKDGEIVGNNYWMTWTAYNLGGPIKLAVFDGCALYLEIGNRFSRIIGPGDTASFLRSFETIKYVVDLRPKIRDGVFVSWTKDGIQISIKAEVKCQIGNPQKIDVASGFIYPYDPLAVKKAIERHSVRWPNRQEGEPSEFTWLDAVWGQVTGIVPSYINSRMLDDLFITDRNGGQILSSAAIQEIFTRLNEATITFGVFVLDFQVLEVLLPQEIAQLQKEYWKAEKQGIAVKREGQARAFNIRAQGEAQADAQRDLILAIAKGLEKNKNGQFTEPLLLSLSGVVDQSLREPLTRAYLTKEALDVIEQIQKILGNDNDY